MPSRTDGKIIPVAAIYRWQPDGSCKAEAMFSEADVFPMREMLVKLEWVHNSITVEGLRDVCQECAGVRGDGPAAGHAPGCALAALLDRLR